MKRTNKILLGCGFLFTVLGTMGCKKQLDKTIEENYDFTNTANVQLFNAIVGSNRTYLYIDNKTINGATIAFGAAFPSNAFGFTVTGGQTAFLIRDTLRTTTQVPMSFMQDFQPHKNYTMFLYDTSTAPRQVTVETNIVIPTDTTARVRFANFAYSTAALPAMDVYSVKRQSNIFTGITKTQVTDFIPYASSSNDTLIVRLAGTNTLVTQLNGFNPVQKRSYTVVLRGGATKGLTIFANR